MSKALLVFVGAGLGGVARYWLGALIHRLWNGSFPWSTFLVNITGCFAMGSLMYLFEERQMLSPNQRLFLMVGILGGYTTFSTFGYEADALFRDKEFVLALVYAGGSMILCLTAIWAGRAVTKVLGI